jgi:hypothetical protein
MNDERVDCPDDEAPGRAYREFATERAPATLNEQVLRQAAREAGRGYPRWSGWLRPLAWVATVGLTLGIVIELVSTPVPEHEAPTEVYREEALPAPAATTGPAAKQRRYDAPEPRKDAPAERSRTAGDTSPASAAFAVDEASPLDQAADIAAARAGSESEELVPAVRASIRTAPTCDEAAREQADTWYRCIERLRSEGHAEAAEHELEKLVEAFPGFEVPRTRTR